MLYIWITKGYYYEFQIYDDWRAKRARKILKYTYTDTPLIMPKIYNVVYRDAYFENSRDGGVPPTPL